jgi:V/A-type H+-transporting ATPase subunit I
MALGMVTGGIAVTVNVIAWMVLGIPVVGIVLALIVLLIGHTYNIAVNILGAFVHSLRLNYVEFFPRFYAGGSGPFLPFREKYEYVTLRHSRAAAAGSESGVRN